MGARKVLLLWGGVLALVVLLGATSVLAAVPTSCSTANFNMNVAMGTTNGITTYEYHMSSPTGKNPNKFFTYVYRGLQGDLQGTMAGLPAGSYEPNGTTAASNCPPSTVWSTNKDNDGYCFTSVAIGNVPVLTVSERYKPEEGATTVILGINNSYESCGPILGPTTAAAPSFLGSPLLTTTGHMVMANGCAYFVTAGVTDNIITDITPDPAIPNATVAPFEACQIINDPRSCEEALNIVYCPPTELGRPPLQLSPGGSCPIKLANGTTKYVPC